MGGGWEVVGVSRQATLAPTIRLHDLSSSSLPVTTGGAFRSRGRGRGACGTSRGVRLPRRHMAVALLGWTRPLFRAMIVVLSAGLVRPCSRPMAGS